MRVHQTLIFFFFFLKLTDGFPFTHEDLGVREGTEGGNITVGCRFIVPGRRKVFCRNNCEDEDRDILCEATDVSVQCGRYGVELINDGFFSTLFNVSITNLTKSDSGWYMCWMYRERALDYTKKFELRVKDAANTIKPKTTLKPARTPSTSTLTPEQTGSSSSGRTTTSSDSPETAEQRPSASGLVPYVRLILVIIVIASSAAVLIVCRRRTRTPEESPVEPDYVNINHDGQVHDEIREDGQSGPPPVETSSV